MNSTRRALSVFLQLVPNPRYRILSIKLGYNDMYNIHFLYFVRDTSIQLQNHLRILNFINAVKIQTLNA